MGMVGRMPERIQKVVVTNTATFRSQEIPLSIASCRIPVFGSVAVRGFNAFAGVATWRATAKGLSASVKSGLTMPYNSWANRIATLRFVENIPLKPSHPSYDALLAVEEGLSELTEKPMLICWGEQDFVLHPISVKNGNVVFRMLKCTRGMMLVIMSLKMFQKDWSQR